MREDNLVGLVVVLAPLSLAAVGGATSIYAPLQHEAVDLRQWVTPKEFLDYFAIMRFMPGPSSMLGALIGWKIEGFWGAVVATLSLYLPSSLLCFAAARSWHKFRGKPWHTAVERGLVPVAAGLVCAGVLALFQLSGGSLKVGALIVGVAAVLTWRKKMHPTSLLLAGAVIFEAIYLAGY
jgi:chromate transporter